MKRELSCPVCDGDSFELDRRHFLKTAGAAAAAAALPTVIRAAESDKPTPETLVKKLRVIGHHPSQRWFLKIDGEKKPAETKIIVRRDRPTPVKALARSELRPLVIRNLPTLEDS